MLTTLQRILPVMPSLPWSGSAVVVSLAVVVMGGVVGEGAEPYIVYSTGFEAEEGFLSKTVLDNQPFDQSTYWSGDPSGDNEVFNQVDSLIEGFSGQYALIGGFPPAGNVKTAYLWVPLNFDPLAEGRPLVTFSTTFLIGDSLTEDRDAFRWSVYSIYDEAVGLHRLFSIEFDNSSTTVSFLLEGDDPPHDTGVRFVRDGFYDLEVVMDFSENVWNATLTGSEAVTIVENQQISADPSRLTLGDIDAVWLADPERPFGDDFMAFDDYRVLAQAKEGIPPRLESVRRLQDGEFLLRVWGEELQHYAVDATLDFSNWLPLKTNQIVGGYFDFLDNSAIGIGARFYRARWVIPPQ